MRAAALPWLMLGTFALAGCATPAAFQEAEDHPLAVSVLGDDELQGPCWAQREAPVVLVRVHVANLGLQAVAAPDYDILGLNEKGDDYPMCPHDEPTLAPGAAQDLELSFETTADDCDVLATLVVRQFYQGRWQEVARLPTGIVDPCT
jgi:hypothetical protein